MSACAGTNSIMDASMNEWVKLTWHMIYQCLVHINDYLIEHGNDPAQAIEAHRHDMTPLHILAMNHYAPADSIAALPDVNVEAAFHLDNQEKFSLDYARHYNVVGLE